MDNIICIAGPTASGKTALAVELAKEFNGEVVSCDSMYVYKRMNIGTAKPTPEEMEGIVHHMIDIVEPDEDFSVSKYCEMAAPIVDDIVARGKTAIIAGGTGLYMDSIIKGNDFADFPSTGYRETLERRVEEEGVAPLLEQLYQVDPESAEHSLNNPRRIIRALEVYYETGMTITAVSVSALDSWVQFFKNIPMALIIFVILESNIFTGEYRSGTLVLSLTKGLDRYKVLIAKTAVLTVLWTLGFWVCYGITYGCNRIFWEEQAAQHLRSTLLGE